MLGNVTYKRAVCAASIVILVFIMGTITYAVEESGKGEVAVSVQPQDNYCILGETTSFRVEAAGGGLTYRWYYSKDYGQTWGPCSYNGYKTNCLNFTVQSYQYGYKFRCLIKDKEGNAVTTEEAYLFEYDTEITSQPVSCNHDIGETAEFSTHATGNKISYRWYYSKDNGETWTKCWYDGYRTDTLSFDVRSYHYGYQFKCLITDRVKNEFYTDIVSVNPPELTINEQPEDFECEVGSRASFSINATGYKISYRWYYSKDNGETWTKCWYDGYKTDTLSFDTQSYHNGFLFYCVVTDKMGNTEKSDIVGMTANKYTGKTAVKLNDKSFNSIQSAEYETLAEPDEFHKNAVVNPYGDNITVSFDLNADIDSDDVCLLRFTAYAEDVCGKINVSVGEAGYSGEFPINTTETEYIIPVSGYTRLGTVEVTLTTEKQTIYIGNFEAVNCGNVSVNKLKTGMFAAADEVSYYTIDDCDSIGDNATDVVTDGTYLYSVYRGVLTVSSIEDGENPKTIGTLEGLGNSREIALCSDGKTMVVSARENGVYIVDISDLENPYKICNLDTLGLATGVYAEGNYCFICSRNYGVEIYDISDRENPEYCSQVYAREEFYDCYVSEGYLYVSVWAQKKVRIYNLSDIYNPYEVYTINLDGNGAGCIVKDNMLYIATGYHTDKDNSTVSSSGYGMGNGMEIYDVSNPESPVWLSSSKIDGRYYYSGFDHWRVSVSGNYAYMMSSYNGMYVYDISNPKAPVRVANIAVNIPNTSKNYSKINIGSSYIFTYDATEHSQGIITDVAVLDGYIYFATQNAGLYMLKYDNASYDEICRGDLTGTQRSQAATDANILGYTVTQSDMGSTIYAVVELDGLYYCAAGLDGILALDGELNKVASYNTEGAAKDIKVNGDYIYVAESDAGLGVYSVEGDSLVNIGRCNYTGYYNTAFSSLNVFSGGNYIAAQIGWTRFALIDISAPSDPCIEKTVTTGTMYYRNLAFGLTGDKYLCEYDRTNITWYTDDGGDVAQVNKFSNIFNAEANGTTAAGDNAVTIYNNGYVYYNPVSATQEELDALTVIKVPGAKYLKGKPAVNGDIMVVSYGYGRQVTIVDISDLDNPVLTAQFDVEGNPDVAYFSGDDIIIPMRHGGIMKISKNN